MAALTTFYLADHLQKAGVGDLRTISSTMRSAVPEFPPSYRLSRTGEVSSCAAGLLQHPHIRPCLFVPWGWSSFDHRPLDGRSMACHGLLINSEEQARSFPLSRSGCRALRCGDGRPGAKVGALDRSDEQASETATPRTATCPPLPFDKIVGVAKEKPASPCLIVGCPRVDLPRGQAGVVVQCPRRHRLLSPP